MEKRLNAGLVIAIRANARGTPRNPTGPSALHFTTAHLCRTLSSPGPPRLAALPNKAILAPAMFSLKGLAEALQGGVPDDVDEGEGEEAEQEVGGVESRV